MASIGLKRILEAILNSPRNKSFHIGELSDSALADLARLNPAYTRNNVSTTTHAAEHRAIKQKWQPEETAAAFDELLSSDLLRGIPNKQGGNRAASEALWLPGEPVSLFAPTLPLRNGGIELRTLHEDYFDNIVNMLERQAAQRGGGTFPISSLHRNASYGEAGSQLSLSAVNGQPDVRFNLSEIFEQVKNSKKVLPFAVGGATGAGALGAASEASAGTSAGEWTGVPSVPAPLDWDEWVASDRTTPEPGLKRPVFDPIDNIIALLTGPAGIAGKAAAGAMETPLSLALDAVLEGAGDGFEYLEKLQPQMPGAWF